MSAAVRDFVALTLELRFEMRFIGETRWWPMPSEDVARDLASYYHLPSLLGRLLEGEELSTRLSVYRLASTEDSPLGQGALETSNVHG
jgi:hypothetical protein